MLEAESEPFKQRLVKNSMKLRVLKSGLQAYLLAVLFSLLLASNVTMAASPEASSASKAATSPEVFPEEAFPEAFPDTHLRNWKRKNFSGETHYELVEADGVRVLKGSTRGAATLLYRERDINLEKTPWIQWSWKVDAIYEGLDEQSRAGDDYPARLYVVARTGFLPWQTYALNYVWSSDSAIDTLWRNPYTKQSAMIAVQSGSGKVGQWTQQRRNIIQDFQRAFGKSIKKINGFAVMVDGDNSGRSATAWFGNIDFQAR